MVESGPVEGDDELQPAQRLGPPVPKGPGDWVVEGPLPVRIRSWRPRIVWSLAGLFLVMFVFIAWASLLNRTPLAVIIFLALSVIDIAVFHRIGQLGFVITNRSVVVVGFWRSKTIPRPEVIRFGSHRIPPKINQPAYRRLALFTRESTKPILLPSGEGLLIPVDEVAARLNVLYGLGGGDSAPC